MVFNRIKKVYIYNETDKDLTKEFKYIKKVINYAFKVEHLSKATFNVIIVDNARIREINKKYRNIDKETDVISFALEDEKDMPIIDNVKRLGDIYISIDKAICQKEEYGHSLLRELCFLTVHGLLHLLGYDHMEKEEEKEMIKEQELILDGQRFKEIRRK